MESNKKKNISTTKRLLIEERKKHMIKTNECLKKIREALEQGADIKLVSLE